MSISEEFAGDRAQLEAEAVMGDPPPWVDGGTIAWPETFWAQVKRTGWCWYWMGNIDAHGYGRVRATTAHRLAYILEVGPIPPGTHIDHTCHNQSLGCGGTPSSCWHRRCVNPAHLEAVTPGENVRRAAARRRRRKDVRW